MIDAARKIRGKLVRVLVVETSDCWSGIPYDLIKQALFRSEEQGHAYQLIEVPKIDTFYGIKMRDYVKPRKNVTAVRFGAIL